MRSRVDNAPLGPQEALGQVLKAASGSIAPVVQHENLPKN